eukprot:TRINITY_DN16922_c0_g1_i2.p4 TRINITY_DN16922_c0_g1~~TRINITY_DN16922_c0_g1_i2.p4  ORF type:complete len:103 (-),score=1.39 TRINITY_DN16922_c0_g1_i2:15-323(-)
MKHTQLLEYLLNVANTEIVNKIKNKITQKNTSFVPLIANTVGGWSTASCRVFNNLISILSAKNFVDRSFVTQYFYQNISIVFQKSSADLLVEGWLQLQSQEN